MLNSDSRHCDHSHVEQAGSFLAYNFHTLKPPVLQSISPQVTALEEFLLNFCERRQLSEQGTEYLMQGVTTQMSPGSQVLLDG